MRLAAIRFHRNSGRKQDALSISIGSHTKICDTASIVIEALTSLWLLTYVINENAYRSEWHLFRMDADKWRHNHPDHSGDMQHALGELATSIKKAMGRGGRLTESDLKNGPHPANVQRKDVTVSAIDMQQNLKRLRCDVSISPMGEQFMIEMAEKTAAACFQCMNEKATLEGRPDVGVNDLYNQIRKTMYVAFAATSRAGHMGNHQRITMARTSREPLEDITGTAQDVV